MTINIRGRQKRHTQFIYELNIQMSFLLPIKKTFFRIFNYCHQIMLSKLSGVPQLVKSNFNKDYVITTEIVSIYTFDLIFIFFFPYLFSHRLSK